MLKNEIFGKIKKKLCTKLPNLTPMVQSTWFMNSFKYTRYVGIHNWTNPIKIRLFKRAVESTGMVLASGWLKTKNYIHSKPRSYHDHYLII